MFVALGDVLRHLVGCLLSHTIQPACAYLLPKSIRASHTIMCASVAVLCHRHAVRLHQTTPPILVLLHHGFPQAVRKSPLGNYGLHSWLERPSTLRFHGLVTVLQACAHRAALDSGRGIMTLQPSAGTCRCSPSAVVPTEVIAVNESLI